MPSKDAVLALYRTILREGEAVINLAVLEPDVRLRSCFPPLHVCVRLQYILPHSASFNGSPSLSIGHKFHNYNLREYVKRRARDGFREMQGIQDAQAADAAYATGKQSVDMIRRQAIIYSMYGRPIKNVIVSARNVVYSRWLRYEVLFFPHAYSDVQGRPIPIFWRF